MSSSIQHHYLVWLVSACRHDFALNRWRAHGTLTIIDHHARTQTRCVLPHEHDLEDEHFGVLAYDSPEKAVAWAMRSHRGRYPCVRASDYAEYEERQLTCVDSNPRTQVEDHVVALNRAARAANDRAQQRQ